MSYYVAAAGSGLILLFAYLVGRGYAAYAGRRYDQYEGLVALIEHMKGQLECYLAGGEAMLDGFRSDTLSEVGFFDGEGDAAMRFERVKDFLTVDADTKDRLSRFFASFGSGYRQAESERLIDILSFLVRQRDAYRVEKEKSVKLVRSLLVAAALGLIILLI